MSKAHAPAFSGPQINIPEGSRGGVNESTPMDQRVADRLTDVGEGPNIVDNMGRLSYRPAKYSQERVVEDRHGNPITHTIIREDR